jgi:hypothetical protein
MSHQTDTPQNNIENGFTDLGDLSMTGQIFCDLYNSNTSGLTVTQAAPFLLSNTNTLIGGSANTITGSLSSAGDIVLTNATGASLLFASGGIGIPTITNHSLGTKIIIKATVSGAQVDYAIGLATNSLWYSVPTTTASHNFYNGTTDIFDITNVGITINPTTNSTSTITGSGIFKGGLGVALNSFFGGTINVAGLLSATLGLTVTGANTSTTTLSSSGLATLNSLTVTGITTLTGNLNILPNTSASVTNPTSGLTLFVDTSDNNLKTKDSSGNINVITSIFGTFLITFKNTSGASTNSTTLTSVLTGNTASVSAGMYHFSYFYDVYITGGSQALVTISVDGTVVDYLNEKISLGSTVSGFLPFNQRGGFLNLTLTQGVHSLDIKYASTNASNTITIRNINMILYRIQ